MGKEEEIKEDREWKIEESRIRRGEWEEANQHDQFSMFK